MYRTLFAIALALPIASPAAAKVVTKSVEYEHDGKKLAGFFAWDDAREGKRPGEKAGQFPQPSLRDWIPSCPP